MCHGLHLTQVARTPIDNPQVGPTLLGVEHNLSSPGEGPESGPRYYSKPVVVEALQVGRKAGEYQGVGGRRGREEGRGGKEGGADRREKEGEGGTSLERGTGRMREKPRGSGKAVFGEVPVDSGGAKSFFHEAAVLGGLLCVAAIYFLGFYFPPCRASKYLCSVCPRPP